MIEGDEWKAGKTAAKPIPHSATVTLTGELMQPAQVIAPVPTEWPKVGALLRVRHNADQHTVFAVVSIGPVAEAMLAATPGKAYKVAGQIKAASGAIEVFATSFEKTKKASDGGGQVYFRIGGWDMGGGPSGDDNDDD